MPKIIKISILATLALGIFSFGAPIFSHFASVSAQEVKGGYELLSPLTPEQVGKEVELGSYLSTLFKIFLAAAGILATLMIVLAGFQYMTSEAAGSKKDALDKFRNAVIGLLLALGSYLFLNTINPKLVNVSFNLEPVDIKVPPNATSTSGTPGQGNPWPSDAGERGRLLAGVGVNKNNCAYVGQKECTSLSNLPSSAINGVNRLAEDCKCSLMITGGTEYWLHSSHGPGKPIVDLKNTQSLNKYLTGKTVDPVNGTKVSKGGATFSFEAKGAYEYTTGPHWHVIF